MIFQRSVSWSLGYFQFLCFTHLCFLTKRNFTNSRVLSIFVILLSKFVYKVGKQLTFLLSLLYRYNLRTLFLRPSLLLLSLSNARFLSIYSFKRFCMFHKRILKCKITLKFGRFNLQLYKNDM